MWLFKRNEIEWFPKTKTSSSISDKPSEFGIYCEPQSNQFKNINKTALDNLTFYLEDDEQIFVDFNDETLNLTLLIIKILFRKAKKKSEVFLVVLMVEVNQQLGLSELI